MALTYACRVRRGTQIGYAPHRATPASTTPVITNGGRAARSRESACHKAAAPATNINGVSHVAASAVRSDTPLIHAFVTAPINDKNTAKIGMRTSPSDVASSIFLTRTTPGSFIPLVADVRLSLETGF